LDLTFWVKPFLLPHLKWQLAFLCFSAFASIENEDKNIG
jgi:hypothetical protein